MCVTIEQAAAEAERIFVEEAGKQAYGDITVTISMHEGRPVKMTHSVSEHLLKRKTHSLVVNK